MLPSARSGLPGLPPSPSSGPDQVSWSRILPSSTRRSGLSGPRSLTESRTPRVLLRGSLASMLSTFTMARVCV
eukprot:7528911-Alexandrium_andersonii.AAC.1